MKITDFAELIRNMPVEYQAFDIKYDIWSTVDSRLIERIFNGNKIITISRNDLFQSRQDIEEQIIKILMWGYPTKGRGKNIDNFLKSEKFKIFIENFRRLENQNKILLQEIELLLKETNGLGFSTFSKILYFGKIKTESNNSLILDLRVISALNSGRFTDSGIEIFKNLSYDNAVKNYKNYLKFMHSLAKEMKTEADRIEMFLFEFGMNLKEKIGQDGDIED